jgi:CRISPR-associated endoribonuclease Cas6
MLLSLVVVIQPQNKAFLPALTGEAVHGMFFRWLAKNNSTYADELHNIQTRKPFTLSGLQPFESVPGRLLPLKPFEVYPDKTYWFRITSCNEQLTTFLIEHLYEQKEIKFPALLNCSFAVQKVIIDQTGHNWAGYISWAELVHQVLIELDGERADKKVNKLSLFFNSPTTFKQSGKPLPLIMPLPEQTFTSLARYWNETAPFPLDPNFLDFLSEGVFISAYELKSEEVQPNRNIKLSCFRGWCEYTLYTDNLEWIQAFHVLARFAFFAGVGYKTGMGFGQTISAQ